MWATFMQVFVAVWVEYCSTAELHGLVDWWKDLGLVTPVLLFQYLFCDYHQVLICFVCIKIMFFSLQVVVVL